MIPLYIASDHAGFELKEVLKSHAATLGILFTDLGTHNLDSVDYPDYANLLCQKLIASNAGKTSDQQSLGILICGSGVGVSIAANRFPEIRAVLAESAKVAKLGREHNHANVLCLGARIVSPNTAIDIIKVFINTPPDLGERHTRRVLKLKGAS